MNVNHPHAQFSRRSYGVRSGIWNIMEFQVEENVEATLVQIADDLWAEQRKHLFAYFQTAIAGINAINKGQCGVTVIVIQSNNYGRIGNYAGSGGCNRRHDQPFSSMGAQRRGTDKRRAFYLPSG